MISVYALVVVYNKYCGDSASCCCLQRQKNINVIIVDNSTEKKDNRAYSEGLGWRYIDMHGNAGLTKAYNRGIERITEKDAIVCLFDDDTHIGDDYFDLLIKQATELPETKIFLPFVYDEIGLLSPSVIDGLVVKRVEDVNGISQESINGINSGMAIRREVFDSYKYDERYFLDYIDHAFLRDMKIREIKIAIFPARLKQEFFRNMDVSMESAIRRFKIFRKDFKRFCGRSINGKRYYFKEIINQKKAMYLKYKAVRVLFI